MHTHTGEEWLRAKKASLKEAIDLRTQVPEGSTYDPIQGLELCIDTILPVAADTEAVVLVYGIFDSTNALMPLQV
jgi:hypothetical protein